MKHKSWLVFVGIVLLWPMAATAQQQPQSVEQREADMFGSSEPDTSDQAANPDQSNQSDSSDDADAKKKKKGSSSDSTSEREAEMFGGGGDSTAGSTPDQTDQSPTSLEQQMAQRLAEREQKVLTFGGGLYSQLQYSVLGEGQPDAWPLYQPNYLDIFLDSRPNKRLRVYADGRLTYTPTNGGQQVTALGQQATATQALLDELWIKFDIDRTVFVTAGRQHLRWGVGRFWYPNDFLYDQRRDPLAIFDVRTGVDIIKLHLPVESLGWNFYAVANLDGANDISHVGGAARAEFLAGLTEFAFSAAAKKGDPLQLGFDISTGIGWFDLRAAVAVLHGLKTPFFRGDSNIQDFDTITLNNIADLQIPKQYSRENDWIPRALVGGEVSIPYGEDDSMYVGAEYFYNDAGYSDPNLYTWLAFNGAYRPLYTGKHYAALYFLVPSPGDWNDTSFSLANLGNLSDRSFMSRLDYSVTVLTHMRAFAFASVAWGNTGEFTQGFHLPAISQDVIDAAQASGQFQTPAGFDSSQGFDGVSVPASRASIGAGLSVDF